MYSVFIAGKLGGDNAEMRFYLMRIILSRVERFISQRKRSD
jgi:hypothetical protein